jgi:hypothetical protein
MPLQIHTVHTQKEPKMKTVFATGRRYLNSHVQLGGLFGWPRSLEGTAIHFHRHGEDGGMDRARLGNQLVLQSWL